MQQAGARFRFPILGGALLLLLALVFCVAGKDPAGVSPDWVRGVDLSSYWVGGKILAEGDDEQLYVRSRSKAELKALFPPKPPFYPVAYPPPIYQLMALPQPGVPYAVAVRVLLMGLATLHLVGARWVVKAAPDLGRWRDLTLMAAFVCPGAVSVVVSGQLAGLWITFLGGALLLRARGKPLLGGMIAAGLWMKPTLAVPLFFAFALLGEGAAVGGMILGGAVILALSLAAGGGVAWEKYIALMLAPGKVIDSMFSHIDRHLTLRALFAGFVPKALWGPVGWTGLGIGVVGTFGLAWLGRGIRDPMLAALRFGVVFTAANLASPHLYEYDAGMHLPATVAAAAWLASGRALRPRLGLALTVAAYFAGLIVLADKALGFNAATLLVTAWVIWMGWEMGKARRAEAGGKAEA